MKFPSISKKMISPKNTLTTATFTPKETKKRLSQKSEAASFLFILLVPPYESTFKYSILQKMILLLSHPLFYFQLWKNCGSFNTLFFLSVYMRSRSNIMVWLDLDKNAPC